MSKFNPGRSSQRMSNGLKSGLTLAAVGALGGATGYWISQNAIEQPRPAAPVAAESAPPPAAVILEADAAHALPRMERRRGQLRRNSTLIETLEDLGADAADAYYALHALYDTELIDPRRTPAGLELEAVFQTSEAGDTLVAVTLKPDAERSLIATRTPEGGYLGAELKAKLSTDVRRVAGTIETSLYDKSRALGAGDQQVVDFAQIFAYDIDFQREVHPGDKFEIVYEALVDERGRQISSGNVLYAELDGKALTRGFYRFQPEDDRLVDYFDRSGKSATRFLMKTPINGARISSSFGRRRHPISGYTRLHKGTDFAAPTGTPIYAAGNGVVERASRYGGYGHYIRIRHANGYKTAYAHLSRYARGLRSGKRVRQGDVIGYVGSTGASTGPHLHYEVIKNGEHVNAMRLKLPTGRTLEGDVLERFDDARRAIDRHRLDLGAEIEIAAAPQAATATQ
ncbi:MAG: M23 family metallopeptidase [Pseudomonadota bacterium]